jgi:hypothetical protein
MAAFQPIVRATVVDLQADCPQPSDRFLIDTNVWVWLTYTRSQNTSKPPKNYQVTAYPKYIQTVLNAKSQLFWSGLSIAELTSFIERSEYDIFCQSQTAPPSRKEYRHGLQRERNHRVIPETEAAWNLVKSYGQCLENQVTQSTTEAIINNLADGELDGYDSLIINSLDHSNINQVITDDIDFVTATDIVVFTANRNAIAAARSQNRLLKR